MGTCVTARAAADESEIESFDFTAVTARAAADESEIESFDFTAAAVTARAAAAERSERKSFYFIVAAIATADEARNIDANRAKAIPSLEAQSCLSWLASCLSCNSTAYS